MKEAYRGLNFSHSRVKIRIEGFRIDKLLSKAIELGLDVRNIRLISEVEAICVLPNSELKQLRKAARSLYKITELEHTGVACKVKRMVKSPVKIAGAILIAVLVAGQSFFVKTVDVNGYRAIPEEELRKCLREKGVQEGAYIPAIDWGEAEEHIYDVFPQVSWLKLAYDGRRVMLEVQESEGHAEEDFGGGRSGDSSGSEGGSDGGSTSEEQKFYSNIVAARAGYIESINTYRGLGVVQEGVFVEKGQVLISGYVPIEPTVFEEGYPKSYFVRSDGEIWARVPYRLNFNQERYVRGAAAAGGGDKSDGIVADKREKTEKEVRETVNRQIRLWAKENMPEKAQILNKDLKFSYKENIIEAGVTLEVRQQIGEEQEILIGQKNTDSSGD